MIFYTVFIGDKATQQWYSQGLFLFYEKKVVSI
jgi:hypothetical protein